MSRRVGPVLCSVGLSSPVRCYYGIINKFIDWNMK
jgi:hypothetical protein